MQHEFQRSRSAPNATLSTSDAGSRRSGRRPAKRFAARGVWAALALGLALPISACSATEPLDPIARHDGGAAPIQVPPPAPSTDAGRVIGAPSKGEPSTPDDAGGHDADLDAADRDAADASHDPPDAAPDAGETDTADASDLDAPLATDVAADASDANDANESDAAAPTACETDFACTRGLCVSGQCLQACQMRGPSEPTECDDGTTCVMGTNPNGGCYLMPGCNPPPPGKRCPMLCFGYCR